MLIYSGGFSSVVGVDCGKAFVLAPDQSEAVSDQPYQCAPEEAPPTRVYIPAASSFRRLLKSLYLRALRP